MAIGYLDKGFVTPQQPQYYGIAVNQAQAQQWVFAYNFGSLDIWKKPPPDPFVIEVECEWDRAEMLDNIREGINNSES